MPSLGSDMEAGTLVEWLVQPGDTVARGDVVAVVETQKGAIEIECFEAGEVLELIAGIGQTLPVGEPLAHIGVPGVGPGAGTEVPAETRPAKATPATVKHETPPQFHASSQGGRASPAARLAAQEAGIDIASVAGTGPGEAVVLADVEGVGQSQARRPPAADGISEMRKAIAAAMTRSKREIPHFYVSHNIETQRISDWLAARNADKPPTKRVLSGAVFVKAAALAARTVPAMNGSYHEDGFHASKQVNVGIAISLRGGGLVAPALSDVDRLSLDEVMAGMRDLVTRARAGRLLASEFTRGTFTVSSLGAGGAEEMTGVIFPPQVALLGIGSPNIRPWVADDRVEPREVTKFVLSADHRACDGRQASKFMLELESRLSKSELL
ncbi:pyruvate dehydrogenase E2 component (dihydrolipoamide acetyltransferase) [Shimia gijangensis]|uniref:Dihydrolipoamide acetyltransferase component of pyruvate dehydrogenase complex n=1 Tax=Shimia gijangensis TaxID=1470563 RepID=A0A1M6QDL9_9RHOB|nr:dihydrolipoamide acetyltransferase family protein [Shimia gijangensis]SHK18349.1 pyruvate dehydrogenase E2 component (dihydrolipoamide acetyltransferase) [Shimia gijangensis]